MSMIKPWLLRFICSTFWVSRIIWSRLSVLFLNWKFVWLIMERFDIPPMLFIDGAGMSAKRAGGACGFRAS